MRPQNRASCALLVTFPRTDPPQQPTAQVAAPELAAFTTQAAAAAAAVDDVPLLLRVPFLRYMLVQGMQQDPFFVIRSMFNPNRNVGWLPFR